MMNAAALAGKHEHFSYLQTSALYKLAAPSTPKVVVDLVADRIKRGLYPTLPQINRSIEKANRRSRDQQSFEASNPTNGVTAHVGNHPPAANANRKPVAAGMPAALSRMDSAKAAEAAVAFLKSRLGSEFDDLLTLVVDAGREFDLAMRALRP